MNQMKKKLDRRKKVIAAQRKAFRETSVPEFGQEGSRIRKKVKVKWKLVIPLLTFGCVLLAIYLPALFPVPRFVGASATITDPLAIQTSQEYLKNNPDMDFDGDGLTNVQEAGHNTNPYKKDSDGDGVMDYAELFVTKTSPLRYDNTMQATIQEALFSSGEKVNSPYKIYDVIVWPDQLEHRASGGMIRTVYGYRFC